ncbi:MAG: UbiX family flavin prenyltransferase [Rhodoferax sp.]
MNARPRPCAAPAPRRVIVGISGASGAVYGVRLLQLLKRFTQSRKALEADFSYKSQEPLDAPDPGAPGVQVHLIVSDTGWRTLRQECDQGPTDLNALADVVHDVRDVGAPVASGSFGAHAMVIAPCSMHTLAAVALGLSDNLLTRAADVMLKERRRLVLLTRETPLNAAHLRHMLSVTEMGAIVAPPVPAFYMRPQSVDALVDHTVRRVLDLIDLPLPDTPRWPIP